MDQRQVADDQGDEAEADARFHDRKQARRTRQRDDIPIAEGEERHAAHVDLVE